MLRRAVAVVGQFRVGLNMSPIVLALVCLISESGVDLICVFEGQQRLTFIEPKNVFNLIHWFDLIVCYVISTVSPLNYLSFSIIMLISRHRLGWTLHLHRVKWFGSHHHITALDLRRNSVNSCLKTPVVSSQILFLEPS